MSDSVFLVPCKLLMELKHLRKYGVQHKQYIQMVLKLYAVHRLLINIADDL